MFKSRQKRAKKKIVNKSRKQSGMKPLTKVVAATTTTTKFIKKKLIRKRQLVHRT